MGWMTCAATSGKPTLSLTSLPAKSDAASSHPWLCPTHITATQGRGQMVLSLRHRIAWNLKKQGFQMR